MNEADIRKYAGLMQELGLTGLEITEDNKVVRLERTPPAVLKETAAVPASPTAAPAADGADYVSVNSTIVGVFYAAPAENAVFVTLGKKSGKFQISSCQSGGSVVF